MNFVQVLLLITYISLNCAFFVSSKHLVESNAEFCNIETNSGRVRGKINRTLFEMKPFYSFRGIPYAKPPIGNLRFKAPQKIDPWNGTLDAFDYGNDCVQTIITGNSFFGSEDCLYLNVFVPTRCSEMNSKMKLSTMLYIYGGLFQFGSSRDYAPDFQMEADVIFVVFNHRTGPFGYLNLNLPEYSGNMGMKDQLLALKWVNENIERFGGDKNKITLFGHSSGGMSTHLHMLNPESKRLFHRAIMLHGVALTNQVPTRKDHTDMIREFADSLKNPVSNNSTSIVEFINEVDALQLCIKICYQSFGTINRTWSVSVEKSDAMDPFLIQFPIDILTNDSYESNIDTLFSIAYEELYYTDEQIYPELIQTFDKTFEIALPFEKVEIDFSSEVYRNISKRIRDHYFDGKHASLDGMNRILSDTIFLYGTDLSARIQAIKSKGHTFVSRFSVQDDWTLGFRQYIEKNVTVFDGSHVVPLAYIFRFADQPKGSYENLQTNSFQRQLIKNISNFYANFAKYGNPLPNTEPLQFTTANFDRFNYYEISNDGISTKTISKQDRASQNTFWDGIYNDYKQHWNISFNFL